MQFDKKVLAYQRNFTKEELIIVINGVPSQTPLKFDAKIVVSDSLSDRGSLVLDFSPYFSIEKATISVGFKNASAIRDLLGHPITKTMSNPFPLDKMVYVDTSGDAKLRNTASKAQITSQITLITNLVISVFLGKALDKIWLSLNACQIIYLMPLMNIPFPRFLKMYLKYLEFANIDINFAGDPFFYQYMNLDEITDKPVSESFKDYQFESSIFFFSYADKIQIWMIVIGSYPIVWILSKVLKSPKFDILRNIEQGYRYNMIIRMLTELYLEITLHAFMNIYSL